MQGLWQTNLNFIDGKYTYSQRRKKTKRYHFIKEKVNKYRKMDKDFNTEFVEGKPPHPMIYNIWLSSFDSKKHYKEKYEKDERVRLKSERQRKLHKLKKDPELYFDMTFSLQRKTYPWC